MTAKNEKKNVLTRAEIEAKIDELRDARICLGLRTNTRNHAVAMVSNEHAPGIEESTKLVNELEDEILQWAKDNRATEFGDSKTLEFGSGAKIQFRLGNKSLVFAAGKDEEKIIAALKKRKLGVFIAVEESLNKPLIKSSWGGKLLPAKIAFALGLRLEQEESPSLTVPLAAAGREQA